MEGPSLGALESVVEGRHVALPRVLHRDVRVEVLGVLEGLLADVALVVLLAEPPLVDVLAVLDVLAALVERLGAQLALELVLVRHLVDAELGVGVEHPGVEWKWRASVQFNSPIQDLEIVQESAKEWP